MVEKCKSTSSYKFKIVYVIKMKSPRIPQRVILIFYMTLQLPLDFDVNLAIVKTGFWLGDLLGTYLLIGECTARRTTLDSKLYIYMFPSLLVPSAIKL